MDVLREDVSRRLGDVSPAVLLDRGSTGPLVAELQRRLKHAYRAYAGDLVIDGVFGPATEAAVREFQRRTPGLDVDGIVGPLTAAALRLTSPPSARASPE
jgi:peptidoglycan hydrolase-like protein with peptidoglycan-binding domain